jgi:hypothetical protein
MPPVWLLSLLLGTEELLEASAIGAAILLYLYAESSGKGRKRR